MINGERARMTRPDAERQASSAARKQLPNVFGSVSIPLFSLFSCTWEGVYLSRLTM